MEMIPPTYDDDTSRGEILLFDALDQCDIEGTCFHSLRLARHPNPAKPTSEADFVILTSEGLLVVEVKGGGISRDTDGKWWQTNSRYERIPIHPGPFQQAEDAQWALMERLTTLVGQDAVRQTPIGWAVSFPQAKFTATSPEWDDWQVHDKRNLGPEHTARWLNKCFTMWQNKLSKTPPPKVAVDALRRAIRGDFHVLPSPSVHAQLVEKECVKLTEEQMSRLEIVESEPRLVVSGGAGTGKTLLAQEIARIEASQGKDVVLMAPSPHLRAHFEAQTQLEGVKIVEAIPRPSSTEKCDVLIVDEAQDLLDEDGLDLISDWVKGGFDNGEWRVLLDDHSQAALHGRFDPNVYELVREAASTSPRLKTNCRNTESVVNWVRLLTGVDLGVATITTGMLVRREFANDQKEEASLLANFLDELEADNVPPGDITILSSSPEQSCVEHLPQRVRRRINRFSPELAGKLDLEVTTLATPMEFKGLENSFICLVDMHWFASSAQSDAELYVAMTRAQACLWMCLPTACETDFEARVEENLKLWQG